MKSMKAASAQEYTLMSQFDELCRLLQHERDSQRLNKPLSYWALPRDRRLPYALLGRPVAQLVRTPFAELSSTPGIGPKKISSLMMLLNRVLQDERDEREQPAPLQPVVELVPSAGFDPGAVSESRWEEWRATVRRHNLGQEKLGRLAPSLRELPTVIWHSRLEPYLGLTLAELRNLKTHGEKRVCIVLEVFATVHELLGGAGHHHRLSVSLEPAFVKPVEQWIHGECERSELVNIQEIRDSFVLPLLNQIEIDAGETVHRLVAGRLGIEGEPESVREQARRLDVTRARIYQLLETCAEIMDVRWPNGRFKLAELARRFSSCDEEDERVRLFEATRLLLFPEKVEQRVAEPVPA